MRQIGFPSWLTNQGNVKPLRKRVNLLYESAARYKWSLHSMSKTNCHGENSPRPEIEQATDASCIQLIRRILFILTSLMFFTVRDIHYSCLFS